MRYFELHVVMSKHFKERWHQRKIDDGAFKSFIRHLNNHFCEVVFDLHIRGCLNGRSNVYKFDGTKFFVTFDETINKLILKTVYD